MRGRINLQLNAGNAAGHTRNHFPSEPMVGRLCSQRAWAPGRSGGLSSDCARTTAMQLRSGRACKRLPPVAQPLTPKEPFHHGFHRWHGWETFFGGAKRYPAHSAEPGECGCPRPRVAADTIAQMKEPWRWRGEKWSRPTSRARPRKSLSHPAGCFFQSCRQLIGSLTPAGFRLSLPAMKPVENDFSARPITSGNSPVQSSV